MNEMTKFIFLLISILMSKGLLADTLIVRQINSPKQELAVSIDDVSNFNSTDSYIITLENNKQCLFDFVEMKDSIVILSSDSCEENFRFITVGSVLEKSIFSSEVKNESSKTKENQKQQEIDSPSLPSRNEGHYLQFGFGLSSFNYDSESQIIINELNSTPGISSVGINLDLFGLYFPINDHKSLVGGMLSAAAERWSGAGGSLQINQYLVAASAQHFFGQNIGHGFFVRGDLGLAFYSVDIDTALLQYAERSETGVGLIFGGGYAHPISSETRLLVNANLSYKNVSDSNTTTFNLSLGLLF